jgi:hypothetical protein
MGGIGERSWLRDEDFEGSTADPASPGRMFSSAVAGREGSGFDVDMTPYRLIRRMETAGDAAGI